MKREKGNITVVRNLHFLLPNLLLSTQKIPPKNDFYDAFCVIPPPPERAPVPLPLSQT